MQPNHRIDPQLAHLAVALADLAPDPRNARLHNERNIAAVADSYQAHGQRKPIVVQKVADDGTPMVVRAGNGQVAAAKKLGWTHVAAIVIDERDRDAIAFALRDNRTADLAEWDYEVIATELARADHEGADFTEYGWTTEELVPLRETTWFMDAKGSLDEHQRKPTEDKDGEKTVVKISGQDARDLQAAAEIMREKFREPKMDLSKVLGRLARHYLATLDHSRAEKPS